MSCLTGCLLKHLSSVWCFCLIGPCDEARVHTHKRLCWTDGGNHPVSCCTHFVKDSLHMFLFRTGHTVCWHTVCFIACNKKQIYDSFWNVFLSRWSHKHQAARRIRTGCLHNQITNGNCPHEHGATDCYRYLSMCKADFLLHYLPAELQIIL